MTFLSLRRIPWSEAVLSEQISENIFYKNGLFRCQESLPTINSWTWIGSQLSLLGMDLSWNIYQMWCPCHWGILVFLFWCLVSSFCGGRFEEILYTHRVDIWLRCTQKTLSFFWWGGFPLLRRTFNEILFGFKDVSPFYPFFVNIFFECGTWGVKIQRSCFLCMCCHCVVYNQQN